jgi:hypothetical protein
LYGAVQFVSGDSIAACGVTIGSGLVNVGGSLARALLVLVNRSASWFEVDKTAKRH